MAVLTLHSLHWSSWWWVPTNCKLKCDIGLSQNEGYPIPHLTDKACGYWVFQLFRPPNYSQHSQAKITSLTSLDGLKKRLSIQVRAFGPSSLWGDPWPDWNQHLCLFTATWRRCRGRVTLLERSRGVFCWHLNSSVSSQWILWISNMIRAHDPLERMNLLEPWTDALGRAGYVRILPLGCSMCLIKYIYI